MRIMFLLIFFLVFTDCIGQTNFKPFTRNASFAASNESAVKDLLDSTARRFIAIANDSSSPLHKNIQQEFEVAKESDRLESFIYPKKLRRNNINVQFVYWTEGHGLYGVDSVWNSETLNAMVLIPLMHEEPKGNSVENLCYLTELEITSLDKLEGGKAKPETSFNVRRVNIAELKGEMLYEKRK